MSGAPGWSRIKGCEVATAWTTAVAAAVSFAVIGAFNELTAHLSEADQPS
jgi:hypothetical protein